ncbi:MAG: methylated-DNA--[protein]-cysteine S-methyltransferase [Candidatus Eremiobacteraeota bacterium]|nr:methylated-DNA--[protein]-cysteine S-methyltransferase [Candidatus Eremiobacteraeota bacterium]
MTTDYVRIARAITFLSERVTDQPQLDEVASHVGLSPFHFQRVFRRWAGVTPKQFLQHLTLAHAKEQLERNASVLDAAYDAGLSSPARLHDHFVSLEAVTPGEFKSGGAGITIRYGFGNTPFGRALIAHTERGICALSFDDGQPEAELRAAWPHATLERDDEAAQQTLDDVFLSNRPKNVRVLANGTNFQVRVWSALLSIPEGEVRTYEQLAREIGAPKSARAVGNALAANSVAVLIPCHRVIQATGSVGNYRWNSDRKRALLAWEAAKERTA